METLRGFFRRLAGSHLTAGEDEDGPCMECGKWVRAGTGVRSDFGIACSEACFDLHATWHHAW